MPQGALEPAKSQQEAGAHERTVLFGTGNVHGKRNKRRAAAGNKFFLLCGAPFAAVQYFVESCPSAQILIVMISNYIETPVFCTPETPCTACMAVIFGIFYKMTHTKKLCKLALFFKWPSNQHFSAEMTATYVLF